MSGPLSLIRLRSGGAILCFHSITTAELPAEGAVHVSLATFQEIIALARHVGRLVPLRELIQHQRNGHGAGGLIAVTMDDAYASLLTVARDFLAREVVPVTVFVVSGAATTGATFWWDRVDDLYPRVARARWCAFENACGLPDAYRRGQPARYGPLRPLRQWVLATHAGRWPHALESPLQALEQEAGGRTRHRSMTWDELGHLTEVPCVELGVHTVSHPVLPLLADRELTREIADGYQALRERFAQVVPILAVPFGLFDRRTIMAARNAGMTASLTLAAHTLRVPWERDDVPRFCVSRHDSLAKLRLRLAGLTDGRRWWLTRSAPAYPDLPSPTT